MSNIKSWDEIKRVAGNREESCSSRCGEVACDCREADFKTLSVEYDRLVEKLDFDKQKLYEDITETLVKGLYGFLFLKDGQERTAIDIAAFDKKAFDYYLGKIDNLKDFPPFEQTKFHMTINSLTNWLLRRFEKSLNGGI